MKNSVNSMVAFPPLNFQQRYIELNGVSSAVGSMRPPRKRCHRILRKVLSAILSRVSELSIFDPLLLFLNLPPFADVTLEASSDEEVEGGKGTEPTHEVEWSQKTTLGYDVRDEGEFARQQSTSNHEIRFEITNHLTTPMNQL